MIIVLMMTSIGCLLFDLGEIEQTCENFETCDGAAAETSPEPSLEPSNDLISPVVIVGPAIDTSIIHEDTAPPVPAVSISTVEPTHAIVDGGTEVVITGENFDETTEVFFGEEKVRIDSVTPTTLIIQTPKIEEEGAVDITVQSPTDTDTYSSFYFFSNEAGNTGAVGVLRSYSLQGNYWSQGSTFDNAEIEIYFLKTDQFHWWELFVPAMNTCMMTDYVTSVDYTLYDFQEPQIQLQAANHDPLTLEWNEENGNYSIFGLTPADLPDETPFDLLPFSNFLQGIGVLDFAMTSKSVEILAPYLNGNYPPMIEQDQLFIWEPTGADWIGISLKYYPSLSDNMTFETMICIVEDTGDFVVDGSLFSQWNSGRPIEIFFGRFVEHQSILPYNNSTARIAGEHVTFASGYTF